MNTLKAYKKWIQSPKRLNDPLLNFSDISSKQGDE
jgi:hypothetical protein